MMDFVIRGTRGTIPVCGSHYLQYGGSTTCFSLKTPDGLIVVDAGTGLCSVSRELAEHPCCPAITFLFTHFHMDHVVGLPYFEPLYRRAASVTIMADPRRHGSWRDGLTTFMGKPYWPIGLGEVNAQMALTDLPVQKGTMDLYGVQVSWFSLPHPQQCLAFRFRSTRRTVVLATDAEYEEGRIDPAFINFCKGADALIFDTHFLPSEYASHRGWGHSTWAAAVEAAEKAGATKLVLTHHSPEKTDADVARFEQAAQARFAGAVASRENMLLPME
jgi:ribonuclease BN (tRNA processing enzyme)